MPFPGIMRRRVRGERAILHYSSHLAGLLEMIVKHVGFAAGLGLEALGRACVGRAWRRRICLVASHAPAAWGYLSLLASLLFSFC